MARQKGTGEPNGRAGKNYSENELHGMRVASQVLKEIRLANTLYTTQEAFITLLRQMGLPYSGSSTTVLQEAENAGNPRKPSDPESSFKMATLPYLKLTAATPESAYDTDRVFKLYRGKLSTTIPLYQAIRLREEAMGATAFVKALKAAQLSKDDLLLFAFRTLRKRQKGDPTNKEMEPRYLLTKERKKKLAKLFDVPEFEIVEMAIAQIQEEVQKRDFPDKPLVFQKEKTVQIEISSEDIARGIITLEVQLYIAESVQENQLPNEVELQDNAPIIPNFVLRYMPASMSKGIQLALLLRGEQARQEMVGDNQRFADYLGISLEVLDGFINGDSEFDYYIYAAIVTKVRDKDEGGDYGNWDLFGDLLGVPEEDRHPIEQVVDRHKHALA